MIFQFTPLREGRRLKLAVTINCFNFNSRPSARGDVNQGNVLGIICISIHAPPRGATTLGQKALKTGAISIHAPPRGATRTKCASCKPTSFQFTPLREGRLHKRIERIVLFLFQFTPLREGRQNVATWQIWRGYFNSRPSARGDAHSAKIAMYCLISIHAPPRGATWSFPP